LKTRALACAVSSFALAAPGRAADAPRPLSLEQAFARALTSNLALGRARSEVAAARGQRRAALALVLPRLAVSGSAVRNSDEVTFGSGDDSRTILPRNDWNVRLTLQQPLFAGLREKRAYDQARLGLESAGEGLRGSEDAVLLQVAADYLAAVQGETLLDVEGKGLELARGRKAHAASLHEAGEATRVDVLRADTAIKAAERRLLQARQLRDAAAGRLRVELALDEEIAVSEPELALPPLPDAASLARRAEAARADVVQAQRALAIAELEVAKQRGAHLPVITADAGYVRQRTTFPKDEYGFAALRFSVPLFQAGEVGARIAIARERSRQAALALEEARRRAREEVRTALLDLQAAVGNAGLADEQRKAAEAEHEQMLDLYRNQEATALDLESAETSLAEARRAVVNGRLERKLAELRAWFAAGSLKAAIQKEVAP